MNRPKPRKLSVAPAIIDRVKGTTGCTCCGREKAPLSSARVAGGLPTSGIVCGLCEKHQGSHEIDLKKRNRDHVEIWQEELRYTVETMTEKHDAEVARLNQRIADLQQELDERPERIVNQNLDQEEVDEAHEHAQKAYRTRDYAFRDLARIHMLHFERAAGKCRCGKPYDDCEEAQIVDGSRALRGWEQHHARRRREGKDHQLPRDHPGTVDARWDPDEDAGMEYDFDEYADPRDTYSPFKARGLQP